MIRLRMRDHGPVRVLIQESSQRRQQSRATVFTAFPKDLSVMKHDPATDIASVSLEFIRQLVSRVTSIDEQQIARLDIDRQRIREDE